MDKNMVIHEKMQNECVFRNLDIESTGEGENAKEANEMAQECVTENDKHADQVPVNKLQLPKGTLYEFGRK